MIEYLKISSCHIQGQTVSSNIFHGSLRRYSLAFLIDNHSKFYLMMQIRAAKRNLYLLTRDNIGRGRLDKWTSGLCLYHQSIF